MYPVAPSPVVCGLLSRYMCGDILCLIHGCVLSLFNRIECVDYIAAPGEDPGKLGPNEFTAGSRLSLNCIVEGNSSAVTYSWSLKENPTPPSECGPCRASCSVMHALQTAWASWNVILKC